MNWISIKDRLPKIAEFYDETIAANIMASEPVLASYHGECVMFGYFEKIDDNIVFVEVPMIYDPFKDCEHELDEISHWMPLPTPVKMEK